MINAVWNFSLDRWLVPHGLVVVAHQSGHVARESGKMGHSTMKWFTVEDRGLTDQGLWIMG